MTSDLELRLIGGAAPSGEIRARDLAVLADTLQELRLRVGRELINAAGPGRTKQYMEELAEIRLAGITTGSTVLTFVQGPTDKLEGMLAEESELEERFLEIVGAIARDDRPAWATDLIADSAAKLVDGLKAAAPYVAIRTSRGGDIEIKTRRLHREVWTSGRVQTEDIVTAKGRLERVDLRTHEFRVRDDVGNAVDLRHVESDTAAGKLIGQWVVAHGRAAITGSGRLIALDDARVEPVEDPAETYSHQPVVSVNDLLARAPGPNPGGAVELDDQEFAAFLAAARS